MARALGSAAVVLLALASAMSAARAAPDCKCRYAGQFYAAGDFACIKTDKGFRLARCALSENVSTWRFLKKGCRGLSWRVQPRSSLAVLYLERRIGLERPDKQSRRP